MAAEGGTTGHRSVSSNSSNILRVETATVVAMAAAVEVAILSSSSQCNNSNSTTRIIREEVIITTVRVRAIIQISLSREVSTKMITRTRLIMDSSISSHRPGDIIIRVAHSTISSSLSMSRRPIRISSSLCMNRPIWGMITPRNSSSDTNGIILGLLKPRSMTAGMAGLVVGQAADLRHLSVGSMTRMTIEGRLLVRKDEDLARTMAHQAV